MGNQTHSVIIYLPYLGTTYAPFSRGRARLSVAPLCQFQFQADDGRLKHVSLFVGGVTLDSPRFLDQFVPVGDSVFVNGMAAQATGAGDRVLQVVQDRTIEFHRAHVARWCFE